MNFELKIKNVGKLSDAKIRIGNFTVLAGPNNTGKSFVSKILYSLFDGMNANHALVHVDNLINPISTRLNFLIEQIEPPNGQGNHAQHDLLLSLPEDIKLLRKLVEDTHVGDPEKLDENIPKIQSIAVGVKEKFLDICNNYLNDIADKEKGGFGFSTRIYISQIIKYLDDLIESLTDITGIDLITSGVEYKTRENLIQNFQVSKLSDLKGKDDVNPTVDISDSDRFEFSNGNINFKIRQALLSEFQRFSKVIYLESPVYWKLKNALERLRMDWRLASRQKDVIDGIPGYFYDLASALKSEYVGDVDENFQALYEKLTGTNVIDGKIVVSESGDLSFRENDRNFSLQVTAMGVVNLGILALLIERKILVKDSFLFIDEPEAHLHPAWQVVMAETLFQLAKNGVNVVVATHSADILKWLEVHVKKHPKDEDLIALNKFPADSKETDEQGFSDKLAAIKQELTRPFADLYMKGL